MVFPDTTLSIAVKNKKNIKAVTQAVSEGGWVVVLAAKGNKTGGENVELARVGVAAKIIETKAGKNGALRVTFEAHSRFKVEDIQEAPEFTVASGAALLDRDDADPETLLKLKRSLEDAALEILELLPGNTSKFFDELKAISDFSEFSYKVAQLLGLSRKDGQELLENTSVKNRLLKLLELLVVRKESLKVQNKINETLSESVGKKQREAILREQMRAIQEELGEGSSSGPTAEDYRAKITESKMPEAAAQIALRELSRLERMGDQSSESHVIRNYLDLLCEMPWEKVSSGEVDLDRAEQVLDRDHYGLKKIKRRILEHLAVMKLRPEKRGSIVLLVGPPGVGKTSLGRSVAEALGREFVRVSLGGVRDDADIRGHRRTYVGALPGRIIDGIRRAKTKDPVFVLDEIDKVSRGWGGDPSSALLEVLDPEQNSTFHDHYLDVPFDLSQVLFVATANSRETIPGPLLDRMEVIELSGYTTDEKFHIAQSHLLPSELESHGLKAEQISVTNNALMRVIEGYTREAGVRSLNRELTKVVRGAAARIAKGVDLVVSIDEPDLAEILGPVRYEREEFEASHMSGVVTGMAWTPVGGDVLFVEAATIPGSGKVTVTGQLGDVMKESSQLAVALARTSLEGVAKNVVFPNHDIHIHVPGGAVPKDGPSAGVTMFTAVASMMLGKPINPKLAMTGEVTLRGKVLPVGGIKEKVLAAARFGVEEVILPVRNKRDLEEIPAEVRNTLRFHFVSHVNELMEHVFGIVKSPVEASMLAVATAGVGSPNLPEPHLHRSA